MRLTRALELPRNRAKTYEYRWHWHNETSTPTPIFSVDFHHMGGEVCAGSSKRFSATRTALLEAVQNLTQLDGASADVLLSV